jgi:transcription initiation factor IIE alpha subunit
MLSRQITYHLWIISDYKIVQSVADKIIKIVKHIKKKHQRINSNKFFVIYFSVLVQKYKFSFSIKLLIEKKTVWRNRNRRTRIIPLPEMTLSA